MWIVSCVKSVNMRWEHFKIKFSYNQSLSMVQDVKKLTKFILLVWVFLILVPTNRYFVTGYVNLAENLDYNPFINHHLSVTFTISLQILKFQFLTMCCLESFLAIQNKINFIFFLLGDDVPFIICCPFGSISKII